MDRAWGGAGGAREGWAGGGLGPVGWAWLFVDHIGRCGFVLLSNASLRSDMSRRGKLTAKSWNSASMADKVLKIIVNNCDKANVR